MRKYVLILAILFVIATGTLFILPGFEKRTDVYLQEFSISEDASMITIKTSLSGSMGYIRGIKTETVNDAVYCSFYCTFGGLNSSIGAKNEFKVNLNDSSTKIYFDRGKETYDIVLEKDTAANIWIKR